LDSKNSSLLVFDIGIGRANQFQICLAQNIMEFLFNQQIDTHHHQQQQQQNQQQKKQNQQSRRQQRFGDRQQLVEEDNIEQQSKRIKLINHDERDLMFQVSVF
jgi:hypothetical protein